jgi:hypothetical protein
MKLFLPRWFCKDIILGVAVAEGQQQLARWPNTTGHSMRLTGGPGRGATECAAHCLVG